MPFLIRDSNFKWIILSPLYKYSFVLSSLSQLYLIITIDYIKSFNRIDFFYCFISINSLFKTSIWSGTVAGSSSSFYNSYIVFIAYWMHSSYFENRKSVKIAFSFGLFIKSNIWLKRIKDIRNIMLLYNKKNN